MKTSKRNSRQSIAARKAAALNVLARGGTVVAAGKAAGVHRTRIHAWLRDDEDFSAALEQAGRESFRGTVRQLVSVRSKAIARLKAMIDSPMTKDADCLKATEQVLKFSNDASVGDGEREPSYETAELLRRIAHAEKIAAKDHESLRDFGTAFRNSTRPRVRRRIRRASNESTSDTGGKSRGATRLAKPNW